MTAKDMTDRKFLIAWGVSLFVLITVSVMPGTALPKMSGGLDKIEHFLAYFIVGALAFKAFLDPKTRNAICVFLIGVGVMLEVLHKYIPGRYFEYADMGANILGVVLAFLFVKYFDSNSQTPTE